MTESLPLLLSPALLDEHLSAPNLLVVDLSKPAVHSQAHIPGAIALDYRRLQQGTLPAPGALPDIASIQALLAGLGISETTHVVACDDEGGGWAARFLWLLESVNHKHYSLLDGGIHAWLGAGFATEDGKRTPTAVAERTLTPNPDTQVDIDWLLEHYRDTNLRLWDARSEEEYNGIRAYATRAGHIPGAIHVEWTQLMDRGNQLRLRPLSTLREELAAAGISDQHLIITYCQTHHRSSLAWFVGRLLDLNIRAYPGSWAEWGNLSHTPFEKSDNA